MLGKKMGKYGMCAELAARKAGVGVNPILAWKEAATSIFPNSISSRMKGCPKDAFLGLCEDGLVNGVPSGSYTRSRLNKSYAIRAVTLLRAAEGSTDEYGLWHKVVGGGEKAHNGQMDVVLALWRRGLLAVP
ncbi:MAG: DUF6979 family protein [Thiohalocapsa sp.]